MQHVSPPKTCQPAGTDAAGGHACAAQKREGEPNHVRLAEYHTLHDQPGGFKETDFFSEHSAILKFGRKAEPVGSL